MPIENQEKGDLPVWPDNLIIDQLDDEGKEVLCHGFAECGARAIAIIEVGNSREVHHGVYDLCKTHLLKLVEVFASRWV